MNKLTTSLAMRNLFFMLLATTLLLQACQDDDVAIGDPGSKLDGINGSWELVQVVQIDETSFGRDEWDVSPVFVTGDAPEITFNSSSFTYVAESNGKPSFIGTSGTWSFKNDLNPNSANEAPEYIELNNQDGSTIRLNLASTIRPSDTRLRVEYTRDCSGTASVSYRYEYERK